MTPEEKAKELGKKYSKPCRGIGDCEFEATQAALEMAQWKEQQMIDKATEWIRNHIPDYYGYGKIFPEIIEDFRKDMEN